MLARLRLGLFPVASLGAILACLADAPAENTPPPDDPIPRSQPMEATEAAKSFHVLGGFQLDLLASEPLVTDPIVIEYDENGLAYVVEMSDYPYTDKSTDKPNVERTTDLPIGRIRILEDTDGDGRFDQGTIFAEELSWPTGIAFWQGGVFVAATPDLWYLKDTNGDRKADVRERVFSGFRKYNVQAVINNLKWGLDHRVYGAGSSNGGKIVTPGRPEDKVVTFAHGDFRFDPRIGSFEIVAGGARFGNTFDDWGNRFICNIRNPAQHLVLENRYLARNPFLPLARTIQDVADAGDNVPVYRRSPPEPWRVLRARRWSEEADRKYPRSETVAEGYFTSASGITIYRGDAYPPEYRGNIFLGEVSGNLIHRQVVRKEGVTFSSQRVDPMAEFVASTDTWFRPVNFINAPDGTLHVCDMYRETIEHPWSIPDDIKAKLDLESGRDRGRIYRLAPPGFAVPKRTRLGKLATRELVALLGHPNAWHRETAHRLLFERQDTSAPLPLKKLLETSTNPLARLHALWSLAGMSALDDEDLAHALADGHAGIREHALRLVEPRLNDSEKLRGLAFACAMDDEIRVRFQLALTLGELDTSDRLAPLTILAKRDPNDEWIRTAVLGSSLGIAGRLGAELAADGDRLNPALLQNLAAIAGASKDPTEIGALLKLNSATVAADSSNARALLQGLGEGLNRSGIRWATFAQTHFPDELPHWEKVLAVAHREAADDDLPLEERESAAELLRYGDWRRTREKLAPLLDPRQPQSLQLRAVRVLASFAEPDVATLLLDPWTRYTPAVRAEVIEVLLARKERLAPLFDAIEAGLIPPGQINPTRRALLVNHGDQALRERAKALFQETSPASTKQVLASYRAALANKSDRTRGKEVFQTHCATCHKFAGLGKEVGPDLATVRHRTPEEILLHVLEPNREVAPNFLEYIVTVDDGRVLTGIIDSETANSITLRRAENVQETLLRRNIEEMASTTKSLMPEGLEQKITPAEMADLIAFIRGGVEP